MLRATELVGAVAAIRRRHAAVGPGDAPPRWMIDGLTPRRGTRQDAAVALDQHIAGICSRLGDQGNPLARLTGPGNHLLRASAGFAKASPREDEPRAPVPRWGQLIGPRPKPRPLIFQRGDFGRR